MSLERDGSRLQLSFDHVGSGLAIGKGYDQLVGFAVSGADGSFWTAEAVIQGDRVVVSSELVPDPVHVRYAWTGNPQAALYNREGLPASPFRTDDFKVEDAELYERPSTFVFTSATYEAEIGWDGCLVRLRVNGEDFLDTSFEGSRGLFFLDFFDLPHRLLDRNRIGPNALEVSSLKTSIRYEFGPKGISIRLKNKTDENRRLIAVLPAEVEVESSASDESETSLVRGDSRMKIKGGKGIKGPWSQAEKIWEAVLKPWEEMTIEFVIGP